MPESTTPRTMQTAIITSTGLDALIKQLAGQGFTVIGPTVRDGKPILREIAGTKDLPAGWSDSQEPGKYRLQKSDSPRLFDCVSGAHSWKQFLFPARRDLWSATRARSNGMLEFVHEQPANPRHAFLGVHACDLSAIAIQDRVFIDGKYPDPVYAERREATFIIAVNCTHSGSTCFCASMGTGPRATQGFDLALTELSDGSKPKYVVETGTKRGTELLSQIESLPADQQTAADADALCAQAAKEQLRFLDPQGARQALLDNLGSPRWQKTAQRCLACGNCAMVCPTCFCSTVEDTTDLKGDTAVRQQVWDTCFHLAHSYIHGGSVRKSTAARYRQWITHKLATWYDQFGTAGCVGCGRCITWCPVGIDIIEEVEAISPAAATVETQGIKQHGEKDENR